MKTKKTDIMMQNNVFGWIAIGTAALLMIPLVMMQVSSEWNWSFSDFIIMGALIFGMGSLFVLTARKVRKHRLIIGILFLLAFLYIYAELAVGIFTNIGS
jgi:uncharacterized membrane protein YesL